MVSEAAKRLRWQARKSAGVFQDAEAAKRKACDLNLTVFERWVNIQVNT